MADTTVYTDTDAVGSIEDGSVSDPYINLRDAMYGSPQTVAGGDRLIFDCQGAANDLFISPAYLRNIVIDGAGEVVIQGNHSTPAIKAAAEHILESNQLIFIDAGDSVAALTLNDEQAVLTRDNNARYLFSTNGTVCPDAITIDGGFFEYTGDGTGSQQFLFLANISSVTKTINITGAVIKNFDRVLDSSYEEGINLVIDKCVIDCQSGSDVINKHSNASVTIRNTAIIGATSYGTGVVYENCATESGSVGTNGVAVADWDVEFTNRAANDYTLAGGSNLAGAGTSGQNIGVEQPPYAAPNITSALALSSISNETALASITVDKDTTVDFLLTAAGSAQPTDAAFDGAAFGGNATANTAFSDTITGGTPGNNFRVWARVSDGTTDLYQSADGTFQNSTLAVDSAPATITRNGSFSVDVSNPATAPTTGNTSINMNGAAGPALTVDSVSGAGPYTINFSVADPALLYDDATGYVLHIDINGETVDTAQIPFTPPAGYDYITLGPNYVHGSSDIQTLPEAVDDDQLEWETNAGAVAFDSLGLVTYTGTPAPFDARVIDHTDGVRGSFAEISPDNSALALVQESLATNVAGDRIFVNVDRNAQVGAGGSGGFSATINAVAATVGFVQIIGNQISLSISPAVQNGDAVLLSYANPGDGIEAIDNTEDLQSFTDQAVTNSVPAETIVLDLSALGPMTNGLHTQSIGTVRASETFNVRIEDVDQANEYFFQPVLSDAQGLLPLVNVPLGFNGEDVIVTVYDPVNGGSVFNAILAAF